MSITWSKKLELIYRMYARATQDVSLDMHLVQEKVEAIFGDDVTCEWEDRIYFPIRPEDETALEAKGYLITEMNENKCVLIYGIKMTMLCKDATYPHDALDALGELKFQMASIRIVEQALTNVIAE